MSAEDYAIVIGLSAYPKLGPPPADLQGPENDAKAIHKWLVSKNGGAVPAPQARLLVSSQYAKKGRPPTREDLEQDAFFWIEDIAVRSTRPGNQTRVGRRLYFFLAGHGFSSDDYSGALLTGDVRSNSSTANIGASLWLQWWKDANYFSEYVMWMDCCMNRMSSVEPGKAPLIAVNRGGGGPESIVMFAARRPLLALEKPLPPNGEVHGVFTSALVDGLNGAARDPHSGLINGATLANWLRNAFEKRLSAEEKNNPDISKGPQIVSASPAIVFATASGKAPPPPPAPAAATRPARGGRSATLEGTRPSAAPSGRAASTRFPVTLRFPANLVGRPIRLWSGCPPDRRTIRAAGETQVRLEPGLYIADSGDGRLRAGFEVSQAESIELGEAGEPVFDAGAPSKTFRLRVNPVDPSARVVVVRADFKLEDSQDGQFDKRAKRGIYKVRLLVGRQISSRILFLDRDTEVPILPPDPNAASSSPAGLVMPALTSPAPLPQSRAVHEYHEDAVRTALGRRDVRHGTGAMILVMARAWSGRHPPPQVALPWQDVRVVDAAGSVIADLAHHGERFSRPNADPYAIVSIAVAPGSYFLRYRTPAGDSVEQSLIVPRDWSIEAYLLSRHRAAAEQGFERPRLSLLMRKLGAEWGTPDDRFLEEARVALSEDRGIFNRELEKHFLAPDSDPLGALITAHLHLLEPPSRQRRDHFDRIVAGLQSRLGRDHPDVAALATRCRDQSLRPKQPVQVPPILEASWHLLIAASQTERELIPLQLWQRVHAPVFVPPFCVWSTDAATQRSYREALAESAFGRHHDREPGAGAALAATPSAMPISDRAFEMIVHYEVTSKPVYEAKYRRPIWPGLQSGVTIGIGYDVGYVTKVRLADDWRGEIPDPMIVALETATGVTGEPAKALAAQLRPLVEVPWKAAIAVHRQKIIPRWVAAVDAALPNAGQLSPDSLGALVSLAYNRGTSFSKPGDRYREMRAIKAHMAAKAFHLIPTEIRAMKRLWPGTPGLQRRREEEAVLFEGGLAAVSRARRRHGKKPPPARKRATVAQIAAIPPAGLRALQDEFEA
jgi:hypothetical protein